MSLRRTIPAVVGLMLLAASVFMLGPQGPMGQAIAANPRSTAFNASILAEVRTFAALVGALLLAIALLPRQIVALGERVAPPLLRLDQWLQTGRRWRIVLAALIVAAAIVLAGYSIARHNAFNSKAYDLGLHAQVWWNTSHGRLFAGSVEVDNYLGDHVSPIILPLAPLYRLWPDARLLLLLQASALALGAWPLALLARRRLLPHWPQGAHLAALLLALIYLTYPALGFVNRFEFHEEIFAVPLLLLAFWALEARRLGVMSVALLLALLTKEDVGLTVAAFGLWAWWRGRSGSRIDADAHGSESVTLSGSGAQTAPTHDASEEFPSSGSQRIRDPLAAGRRFTEPARAANADRRLQVAGLLWAAIGVAWSLIALFVVIPAFRGAESDTLARYAWLGSGPADILTNLVDNPGRVAGQVVGEPRRIWMLVKFLLPVGFLSLFSPAILLALPSLAINWLAGNLYQASIYFHYAALLIPVVFAASVYGMERVARGSGPGGPIQTTPNNDSVTFHASRFTLTLLWLAACALLAFSFDQFWQPATGQTDWENYGLSRTVDPEPFGAAAALLPGDAALATTEAFAPHLANREHLHLLHDPRILAVADRVDWVLVDLNDHRYGVNPKRYYGLLRWIAERRGLGVCFFEDDVVLLGPGCAAHEATEAYRARLADLQRAAAGAPLDQAEIDALGAQYFQPQAP